MDKDTQSRKWQLTINNPTASGYTHDAIKKAVSQLRSVVYWCMSDEIGNKEHTPHTHVFLFSRSGIRFSTIKNLFSTAHMEMARGTCQQNMEYVSKTGKWEKDKKSETSIEGTFEEFGEMPVERRGKKDDLDDLYDMIKSGMSDSEILEQGAEYMLRLDAIGRTRQILKQERWRNEFRKLEVTYIWGDTGTGKTRYVMDKYGYSNVYRVTDYQHPFDAYEGQDVLLFDEFRSDLPLADMLKYLDGYPCELPCRYYNKYACYTKVYVISNISYTAQYRNVYKEQYESWLALMRRFTNVRRYKKDCVEVSRAHVDKYQFITELLEEIPFDV